MSSEVGGQHAELAADVASFWRPRVRIILALRCGEMLINALAEIVTRLPRWVAAPREAETGQDRSLASSRNATAACSQDIRFLADSPAGGWWLWATELRWVTGSARGQPSDFPLRRLDLSDGGGDGLD